jgi:hypothetical protein
VSDVREMVKLFYQIFTIWYCTVLIVNYFRLYKKKFKNDGYLAKIAFSLYKFSFCTCISVLDKNKYMFGTQAVV